MSSGNIAQTKSFGLGQGTPFNDIVDIGGFPAKQTILGIKEIRIAQGWLLDGIEVVYRTMAGDKVASHLGSRTANTTLTFNANEYIVGVSGKVGLPGQFSDQPCLNSVCFAIADLSTGTIRVAGPYGTGAPSNISYKGVPFAVAGSVIAFAGQQHADPKSDPANALTLSFVKADSSAIVQAGLVPL